MSNSCPHAGHLMGMWAVVMAGFPSGSGRRSSMGALYGTAAGLVDGHQPRTLASSRIVTGCLIGVQPLHVRLAVRLYPYGYERTMNSIVRTMVFDRWLARLKDGWLGN